MAKTKKQKKAILDQYKAQVKDARGLVIVRATALQPNEVTAFRKELYGFDSEFHVVKNTLFQIALKENELEQVEELNSGENSVIFFNEDIVSPAKSLKEFIDKTKIDKKTFKVEVLTGFLDGAKLTKEQVVELSDMPTKQQSVGLILGILDNAMSGVVNVLEDSVRSYVTIIDQAFKE